MAHGKIKRQGRFVGRRSDWKKAYVKLREGEKMPEFLAGRVGSESCRFANTTDVAGPRFKTSLTFDEITTNEPYAPLTEKLQKSGGRNNQGELTSWWRGGGHKRLYRIIDFKRDKKDIPAKVATVEYDPNRSARIALLTYADGEKRYILRRSA